MKTRQIVVLGLTGTILLGGVSAVQAADAALYATVQPSEVTVPEGVPLGQYRRSFRPFQNWTVICDENFQAKTLLCNVNQSILDDTGHVVFNWSLVAAKDGKAVMLLRTLPGAEVKAGITLVFEGGNNPTLLAFSGCSEQACTSTIPIGATMTKNIGKGSQATISYRTTSGRVITVNATMKGLKEAVSSIK